MDTTEWCGWDFAPFDESESCIRYPEPPAPFPDGGAMTVGAYRKACDAEYEACHILREQGWYVTRCYGERSPPDLFAAREGEFLLLMVRRSRRPVPGARAVSILYGEELDRLRSIGNPAVIRKECWVLSPPDGWKYYIVYPGGIRRVRHAGYDPDGGEYGDEDRTRAIATARNGVPGSRPETREIIPDPLPEITGTIVQSPEEDPTGTIGPDPGSRITGTIVQPPQPGPTGTSLPVASDKGTAIAGTPLPSSPQETSSPILPQVNGHA
jgi:hypothetical protein